MTLIALVAGDQSTAAMMLGLTLVAIVVAYLVLRRTGQVREEAVLPGV